MDSESVTFINVKNKCCEHYEKAHPQRNSGPQVRTERIPHPCERGENRVDARARGDGSRLGQKTRNPIC